MLALRPLAALALGSLREQWRITLALLLGALLLSSALAAVPITHERLRDVALRDSLATARPGALELRVTRGGVALDRSAYQDAQAALDQAVADALGDAIAGQTRSGATGVLTLATLRGGEGPLSDAVAATLGPAMLRFRSDLEANVTLLEGRFPDALPRGVGDPVPVLVAPGSAREAGLRPGQTLALLPRGSYAARFPIVIAGIAEPRDPASPYWSSRPGVIERASSGALALFVPETTFFGALPDLLSTANATFEATYSLNPESVQTGEVADIAAHVRELPRQLSALGGAEVESNLAEAIESAAEVPGFDLPALALRFGQLAAGAGLLVFAASAALVARRRPLRARLRLAGASRTQIATLELMAALPVALFALVAAAPVAALALAALGRLDGFEGLGGSLAFTPQRDLPWAALGALLVLGLSATASATAGRRVMPHGAWLTAVAVGGGALFWLLTRRETLFDAGETRNALLLAPLALLVPVSLLAWLLIPQLARPLARIASASRGVALGGGLRAVARRPMGVVFPLVLLAAAATVLFATLPEALERSPGDRAAHAAGGDVRASGLAGFADAGEGERRAAIAGAGMEAASPLVRAQGALGREGGAALPVEVLGIDPASFGAVANVRPDLTADGVPAILSALSANSATLEGQPLPPDSRQIGAWVRLTDTSGQVRVALSLRNEGGRYVQLLLGVVDAEPGRGPWLFHAADLATPLGIDGAPLRGADLAGRLTLHGYYLLLGEEAATAPGSALLGPVFTTPDPPASPRDRADRLASAQAAFRQRAIVHDLASLEGLEPITGPEAGGASLIARHTLASAPGSRGAQHLDWGAATEPGGSAMRGLRQATDGAPVLIYASRAAVGQLAMEPGEEVTLTVGGRALRAQLAGELDGFPTFPANAAFVVAGLDRLLSGVNASPQLDPLATNEAWFATSTPARAAAALRGAPFEAARVVDRESVRAALGREQAAALGWRAVLAFAFVALLAAAFAAVLLDLAQRREEREQEQAAIEALGGAPAGWIGAVAVETVLRLGASAAVGAAAALPLARWLLAILARDTGATVIEPPLRMQVEAGPIVIAAIVLALCLVVTVGAAGLRYTGRVAGPAPAGVARTGEA